MSSYFLIRLILLPGMLVQRGPRAYYSGTLTLQALLLAAALAWLLTPIGLWQAYGHWWMLLWLIPTAAAIFALALTPLPGGG
jgi:hypothetical protein